MKNLNELPKIVISFIIVLFFRLIPHPPNFEGVTGTLMPLSKRFGKIIAISFGILSVIIFDMISGTIGPWTLFTAGSFALIGYFSAWFFSKRKATRKNFILFAIPATIIYDIITGIVSGMVLFGQSFIVTFYGQIPFTIYHLAGNIIFAGFISPLIYSWVLTNQNLTLDKLKATS